VLPKGHIPKNQFSRPSIDLTPHNKEWQDLPWSEVREGDLVADHGRVVMIQRVAASRLFHFPAQLHQVADTDTDTVRVFAEKRS
jgi:hypothetical protein